MKIHSSRVRRIGILYGELNQRDIMLSFLEKNDKKMLKKIIKSFKIQGDIEEDEEPRLPFQNYLVISRHNTLYLLFHSIYTISTVLSCYFYIALASFKNMRMTGYYDTLIYFFEGVFVLNMIVSFFVEYKEIGHTQPVRDLYKCAMNYLQSSKFIYDFITIIPLQWIHFEEFEVMRYIYMLKLLRLIHGFQLFNVPAIMQKMDYFNKLRLKEMIKNDQIMAADIYGDHNRIQFLVVFSFSLKIFKLMVIIFNISYFLGFFWYIFCDEMMPVEHEKNDSNYFISNFQLDELHLDERRTDSEAGIILVYYMFTSLSTVGFGDYHPRSDTERIMCSIVLLFGVAIFSYVMATFTEILVEYKDLNADLDEGDLLTQFFGLL